MTVSIETLFNLKRIAGHPLSLALLLLYVPVGVVLLVVRLFISLQLFVAVTILPKRATATRLITRCICMVLGLFVRQENLHNNPLYEDYCAQAGGKRRLMVYCNHVTSLDHLAISTVMPCVKLSSNGLSLPKSLLPLVGCSQLGLKPSRTPIKKTSANLSIIRKFLDTSDNPLFGDLPLLVFPEESTTNGTGGLLKYETWPLVCALTDDADYSDHLQTLVNPQPEVTVKPDKGDNSTEELSSGEDVGDSGSKKPLLRINPLLLVSLKVKRFPPLPIHPSVLSVNSSVFFDVLSLLLCPFTVYTIRYLGCIRPSARDTLESLSLRLQHTMAHSLGIEPTLHTAADKEEYRKRVFSKEIAPPSPHLVEQVRQVLPHVPIEPILRDLARTKSVDLTIANLLENKVSGYDPHSKESLAAAPSSPSLSTSATDFSLDPSLRMTSFQQRKLVLLQNARHNYIAKYGFDGERDPYLKKRSV